MPLRGHRAAAEAFLAAMAGGAMHHAWIVAGPPGIGKATFARKAALRALAEAMAPGTLPAVLDIPDDHRAATLFAAGSHPDYRELRRLPKKDSEELARSITVDQVRTLGPFLGTMPSLSTRRAIVIDAADDLERPGASNALLKNLEEPPADTLFLLVSHAPGRLLPTIRSRCRLLRLEPLATEEVAAVLGDVMPDADGDARQRLLALADGSPGRAIGYAGLDMDGIDATMGRIAVDGDPTNAERIRLSKSLTGKSAQPRYEAFLDRVPTLIARAAAVRAGTDLRVALDAYDEARNVAAAARGLSLDAQATVYELAAIVARLSVRH